MEERLQNCLASLKQTVHHQLNYSYSLLPRDEQKGGAMRRSHRPGYLNFFLITFCAILAFKLWILNTTPPPISWQLDPNKRAVLLDPRGMMELVPLVQHFVLNVPPEWQFQLWVSEERKAILMAATHFQDLLSSKKLLIDALPKNVSIHDGPTLSEFLVKPWLWEHLAPAENLFFFQADSVICSKTNYTLNDFLGLDKFAGGYDWVGAPWLYPGAPTSDGGNGGFSIRRRSTMLSISSQNVWNGEPEDVWFVQQIASTSNRFPTPTLGAQFALEDLDLPINPIVTLNPFGLHLGFHFHRLPESYRRELSNWCPELALGLSGHIY